MHTNNSYLSCAHLPQALDNERLRRPPVVGVGELVGVFICVGSQQIVRTLGCAQPVPHHDGVLLLWIQRLAVNLDELKGARAIEVWPELHAQVAMQALAFLGRLFRVEESVTLFEQPRAPRELNAGGQVFALDQNRNVGVGEGELNPHNGVLARDEA